MSIVYEVYSCNIYKALANYEGDDHTIWVDFDSWKKQGEIVLQHLWHELKWSYPIGSSKAALIKSEKHKNRPESYKVIAPEKI